MRTKRLAALLCFLTGALLVATLVERSILESHTYWASQRLSGALAWLYGIPLYDSSAGARTGWAYFPLAAISLSWTAVMGKPSLSLIAASLTSTIATLIPVVVFFLYQSAPKKLSWRERLVYPALFVPLCLGLATSLGWSLSGVHVDGLSFGFCGLSAVLLSLRLQKKLPSKASVDFGIALFAVAAFWTKQNQLFTPVAILAAATWESGWKQTQRLALFTLVLGLVSFGCVATFFDLGNLYFNCVTLVSGFPWRVGLSSEEVVPSLSLIGKMKVLYASFSHLYQLCVIFIAGCLGLYWAGGRVTVAGQRVFWVMALSLLPFSVMGPTKMGGAPNGYSPFLFFLLLTFLSQLFITLENSKLSTSGLREWLLVAFLPLAIYWSASNFQQIRSISENPEDTAFRYLKENPNQTLLLDYPMAQLLARKTIHVVHYALMDREWSGYSNSPEWIEAAIPGSFAGFIAKESTIIRPTLPSYEKVGATEGFPGMVTYRRR